MPAPEPAGDLAPERSRDLAFERAGAAGSAWPVAAREAWRAFWASRLLVWVAGLGALAVFGVFPGNDEVFDPFSLTAPFGDAGDLIVAPGARWDGVWYLAIAQFGYEVPERAAFFPLYVLLIEAVTPLTGSALIAGLLISLGCFYGALVALHRLVTLDLGARRAQPVLLLVALFPTALFFSAIYTEALYLLLSVVVIYAARTGRWATVGLVGAAAAATRTNGVVLLLPALILYGWGPRLDRRPDRDGRRWWVPRYRVRPDALWLALMPAGLLAYLAYHGIASGDPLAPFHAQANWNRELVGPLGGIWEGFYGFLQGGRQLLSLGNEPDYFPAGPGVPLAHGARMVVDFGFLLFALGATAGVLRRLPFAYGAYVIGALMLPLSMPAAQQPLNSLPRFLAVLFPLHMWLVLATEHRPRARRAVVGFCAFGLVVLTALFVTWTSAG